MTATLRAGVYCRISEDREGRELGVQRQAEDIEALTCALSATVVDRYVDNDISASTRSRKDRPQYKRLIADARAGRINLIVAYTSSRLTRRPREHEDLIELAEQCGTRIAYVRSPSFDLNTSAGRMVARVLAAADANEAESAAERIKRQKQQAAQSGTWKGGRRPFGFNEDGVTIRDTEACELREASMGILHGASITGQVRSLNARGITTTAGNPWDGTGWRRTLMRARNAGLMEHHGQVVGNAAWPAIVDEPTWTAVRAVLDDPLRRTTPGGARRWRGSGLYLCFCGATVNVMWVGGKRRTGSHHSYVCASGVRHMGRVAGPVDEFVDAVVVERLSRPDAAGLLDAGGDELAEAVVHAASIRAELAALAEELGAGHLSAALAARAEPDIRARLAAVEMRIATSARGSVFDGLAGSADVAARWAALDLDRQRAVIDRLLVVELLPSPRGRRKGWRPGQSYFDPATVRVTWKG